MQVFVKSKTPSLEDFKELYFKYADEYDRVYMDSFGEAGIFIYRTLGRKDYSDIVSNEQLTVPQKEEVICEICTLYPQQYNFSECEMGGLPSLLAKRIVELSLLDGVEKMVNAIHYYRSKLENDLDEQVNCVIHEAFPEFKIEEIQNWDIEKSAEYMSKAEFILHNLRGVPLSPTKIQPSSAQQKTVPPVEKKGPQSKTINKDISKPTEQPLKPKTDIITNNKEDIAKNLAKAGIDWRQDSVLNKGIDGILKARGFSVEPAALAEKGKRDSVPNAALAYLKEKANKQKNEEK